MITKNISREKLILLFGDIIIIFAAINLASQIRINYLFSFINIERTLISLVIIVIYALSFYIFDFYNTKIKFTTTKFLIQFIGALALASLLIIISFLIFPYFFGRGIFLISLIFIAFLVFLWRILFSLLFRVFVSARNVLIIGEGKEAQSMRFLLKDNPQYKLLGIIPDESGEEPGKTDILRNIHSVEKVVNDYGINDIILTIDPKENKELEKALVKCRIMGINIYDIPTFYEHLMDKLPITQIRESWFFYCDGFQKLGNTVYKRFKRIVDLVFSFLLLLISLPLVVLIILLIKSTSRGPFLYTQERLGENMKPFKMLKFRTMVKEAEKREPKWAEENDIRVTRVGKILRKLRFDELPQFINILRGEMSLIGPRPEREYFVKRLMKEIPYYSLRFALKPGLTGWAQVNYGYGSTVEDVLEKLSYELYYIKNMSLFMDLRILLRTLRVMLFGMGR